jgi:hypothetical protein
MDPKGVQPIIDALVKYNVIDKRIDAADYIAPSAKL